MTSWDKLFAPTILLTSVYEDMDLSDMNESIIRMEYTSSTRKMDKCVLIIENRDLRYSDDPRLDREIRFYLKWGYPSGLSETREMIVAQAAPSLSSGVPSLTLTAYDAGQDLTTTGARNWGAVSSSHIARQIAARHNLEAEVVDSNDARREHRLQTAQVTDYEFLARLADDINYDFSIERGVLRFVPVDTGALPHHRFVYYVEGNSILKSFRPTVKKKRIHRRTVSGANSDGRSGQERPRRQQQALGSTSIQVLNTATARRGPRVTIREGEEVVRPSPETDERVRRLHASADQHAAEMQASDMTAELVGYPTVKKGQIVEVYVVERRYSGLWRVQEALHVVEGDGYATRLKVKRAEVNSATSVSSAQVPRNERNNASQVAALNPGLFQMTTIDTQRAIVRPTMVITRPSPSLR